VQQGAAEVDRDPRSAHDHRAQMVLEVGAGGFAEVAGEPYDGPSADPDVDVLGAVCTLEGDDRALSDSRPAHDTSAVVRPAPRVSD
jgi:hypothetical protein